MTEFHTIYAFALLGLIPVAVLLHLRSRRRPAVRFSSVEPVRTAGTTVWLRLRYVPLIIRVTILVLLVLAIARPREGTEKITERNKGVALEMVVDRSSSMRAEMKYEGEQLNRLEVAKRVFREFVAGNDKGLQGRRSDLIGMVAFARYADTVCPLTHNHGALMQFIDATDIVTLRSEDGTAIGDALALAAARLKTAEEDLKRKRIAGTEDFTIESKAIVLLTDGQVNAGKRHPVDAAKIARDWGIKIYCIGIGEETITTSLTQFFFGGQNDLDEEMLTKIANTTGGFFKKASDSDSLRRIYEEIDRLEKTEIATERYINYREQFSRWAVPAIILLLLEIVLGNTIFMRLP